ncbi:BQ2448_1452 [Microbotryum intermedium]|uniref:BQ2448_1452 protein n=1 Tax=Microbotryum intermedium TaxID=269621 RepID=A0A238FFY6_9BASI|nr:BQ2448_1452 [Microbotryum intermedium]
MRLVTNLTQHLALARSFATMANSSFFPTLNSNHGRSTGDSNDAQEHSSLGPLKGMIEPRVNVLGTTLQPIPITPLATSTQPTTGFFRTNYCDASRLDPGSHTIAALITPSFLTFSASKGNDLSSLFPRQGPSSPWERENQKEGSKGACYWCLCASRWWEAVKASQEHPEGESIVPKVVLGSTHALWSQAVRGVAEDDKRKMLDKFAIKSTFGFTRGLLAALRVAVPARVGSLVPCQPPTHRPKPTRIRWFLCFPKLAHLLDSSWWRTQAHHLSTATSTARSDVLESLYSHLAQFDSTLRASDNLVAHKAVQLLDHPTTSQSLTLLSTYSPFWFPALLILFTSLYSRRSTRLSEQRRIDRHISARLQARAYAITDKMFDLGLGTPNAQGTMTTGSGKGWGEVEVQWGKEKIRVPLPPPNSPLSTLKAALFNITGVVPDHQKLIYSGALLKDDLAPLSSFGLIDNPQPPPPNTYSSTSSTRSFWDSWSLLGSGGSGSKTSSHQRKLKKLILLGSKDVSASIDDRLMTRADLLPTGADEIVPIKPLLTEDQVVDKIQEVAHNKLKTLGPDLEKVEQWVQAVEGTTSSKTETEAETETQTGEKPNPRTLIFLSEALLQALLKLDSIEVQSGYDRARAARKQGVRDLQAALDRVDALKPRFKAALAKE